MSPGARAFGLGVIALGLVGLAYADFVLGQPVPRDFPHRTALAYAAAAFMIVAGAGLEWRRTVGGAAAALAAYYTVVVVVVMNGRVVIAHFAEYGTYSGLAEQVAIAAAAFIVWASNAAIDPVVAGRFTRVGQVAFGVCAFLFGGAHFAYMELTAPLVPRWLPPSQEFWAYATACGHIAAGIAIIARVKARTGALLLTAMYASFTALVHVPMLLADSSSRMHWTENAINLSLVGVAWVVAESFEPR